MPEHKGNKGKQRKTHKMLDFMWAETIPVKGKMAVMTKHSDSWRESQFTQPTKESKAAETIGLLSVVFPIMVDVMKRKELCLCFTATRAFAPVVLNTFKTHALLIRLGRTMAISFMRLKVFFVGALVSIRVLLAPFSHICSVPFTHFERTSIHHSLSIA